MLRLGQEHLDDAFDAYRLEAYADRKADDPARSNENDR